MESVFRRQQHPELANKPLLAWQVNGQPVEVVLTWRINCQESPFEAMPSLWAVWVKSIRHNWIPGSLLPVSQSAELTPKSFRAHYHEKIFSTKDQSGIWRNSKTKATSFYISLFYLDFQAATIATIVKVKFQSRKPFSLSQSLRLETPLNWTSLICQLDLEARDTVALVD